MIGALRSWLLRKWVMRRRRPSKHSYKQVGIFKVDRLGDFVLALGAIRQIVDHEGAENCVLIISPHAEALAHREFPDISKVVLEVEGIDPANLRRLLRKHAAEPLFRDGVNRLICLRHQRTEQHHVTLAAIPAAETWGAIDSSPGGQASLWKVMPLDHGITNVEPEPGETWELARHREVVSVYLGRHVTDSDVLPLLTTSWMPQGAFVSVSPFGSNAIRDFPPTLLVAAAHFLWTKHRLRLCLLSPPGDVPRYEKLTGELTQLGVPGPEVRVCPSLEELIQAISQSRLVLSVETATAHLATAMDLPMVALVGGGHLGWLAPWQRSTRQQWLTNEVACSQCNWRCSQSEPICITQIRQGALLQAITRVLAETSK